MDSKAGRTRAVVIGGSIAGLFAARVLSDHYAQVRVLERDELGNRIEPRRGVPQGRHAHVMLSAGYLVLDRLFPGLVKDLCEAGATPADPLNDGSWYLEGGHLARAPIIKAGALASRPLIETHVRRHLLKLANVMLIEGSAVKSVEHSNGTVNGVTTENGCINADLVVDASGRGSRTPALLKNLGYEPPEEDEVTVRLTYTTREFRRRPDQRDAFAVVPPTPLGKRGGVLLACEGEGWICTLFGHFGEQAPEELGGFLEWAASLPAPDIYNIIRNAEPIGEPRVTRFPANLRRRYEKLARFPKGLLVFGDAMSSFNPVYAQGMTVAALEAEALGQELEKGTAEIEKRFFTRAAKLIDTPWKIAVGGDLRMPEVDARRQGSVRFLNWYVSKLHKCGHHDPVAAAAFIRVAQMLDRPESILHPKIAMRVLKSLIFPRRLNRRAER